MVEAEDATEDAQIAAEAPQLEQVPASSEAPTSTEPPALHEPSTSAEPELQEQPLELTEPDHSGQEAQAEEHSRSNGVRAEETLLNGPDAEEAFTVQESSQTQNTEKPAHSDSDTSARLEAMAEERESLRAEVAELRKSLETVQSQHQEELSGLREDIDEAQAAKDDAETQYRTLLGKVNTIRSQLGERLKADAVRSTGAGHCT